MSDEETKSESDRLVSALVHIDVDRIDRDKPAGKISIVGRRINQYMLRRGFYDPRIATQFLDTLLDEEKDQTLENVPLKELLNISGMTRNRYELWRVRDFDVDNFYQHLLKSKTAPEEMMNLRVQMLITQDNEDERVILNLDPPPRGIVRKQK